MEISVHKNQITVALIVLSVTVIDLSVADISLKPCFLQYRIDRDSWFVVLTIPKPDDVNVSIRLNVTLLLPLRLPLPSIYGARLTFVAITNATLVYHLQIPQSWFLPRVTRIEVNGRPICSEPLMTLTPSTTEVYINYVTILNESSNTESTATFFNLSSATQKFNDIQDDAVSGKKEQHEGVSSAEKSIHNFGHDFNPKPPDGNCGRTIIGNFTLQRLANGDTIDRADFPWLAAMFVKKDNNFQYKCVANLISQKHAVTAGHCVKYMDQPVIDVSQVVVIFLGKRSQFQNDEDSSLKMKIEQIHLFPEHKSLGYISDSDLAVLEFESAIEFNDLIRPICLWSGPSDRLSDIVGAYGTVVGWEVDAKGKLLRPELRAIRIPIVSEADCLRSNEAFAHFTSNRTFCAGLRDGKTGPCEGDSGGGLMLFRENRWLLRGVVSLSLKGTASCDLSNYVVFVDVAQYRAWFDQFLLRK